MIRSICHEKPIEMKLQNKPNQDLLYIWPSVHLGKMKFRWDWSVGHHFNYSRWTIFPDYWVNERLKLNHSRLLKHSSSHSLSWSSQVEVKTCANPAELKIFEILKNISRQKTEPISGSKTESLKILEWLNKTVGNFSDKNSKRGPFEIKSFLLTEKHHLNPLVRNIWKIKSQSAKKP